MKQSFNLKVQRMFWTPLRSGFVVIDQPMNERNLKFSRNRNSENNLLDLLMQRGSEMGFKFGTDEQVTDLVWQKDQFSERDLYGFDHNTSKHYSKSQLHWIIQSIEYQNTETLLNQLYQSLDKVKLTEEDYQLLKECEKNQPKYKTKEFWIILIIMSKLEKSFSFQTNQETQQMQQRLFLPIQMLCISKVDCLRCKACESVSAKNHVKLVKNVHIAILMY